MRKAKQISLAKDVAKNREDQVVRQLANFERMLLEKQQQMSVLEGYKNNYVNKAQSTLSLPGLYQNFQQFMSLMSQTIDSERQALQDLQEQRDECLELYRQYNQQTSSLEKILAKVQQQVQKEQDIKEQKMMDELSQHYRRDFGEPDE